MIPPLRAEQQRTNFNKRAREAFHGCSYRAARACRVGGAFGTDVSCLRPGSETGRVLLSLSGACHFRDRTLGSDGEGIVHSLS
jgi:hypothetical protein